MTTATATRPAKTRKARPTVADKAEALLSNSATWLRCRDRHTGRLTSYGIPSLSEPGKYHLTNGKGCDCEAGQHGSDCCHKLAAALYIAQRREEAASAASLAARLLDDDATSFTAWLDALADSERLGRLAEDELDVFGPAELGVAA